MFGSASVVVTDMKSLWSWSFHSSGEPDSRYNVSYVACRKVLYAVEKTEQCVGIRNHGGRVVAVLKW